MIRFFSLALFLIFFNSAFGQKFEWATTFGAANPAFSFDDQLEEMVTDVDGNIYTVGRFQDSLFMDGQLIIPKTDSVGRKRIHGFITKHDETGKLSWVKVFEADYYCAVRSIDVDKNGNVYTTGRFLGLVDFNPAEDDQFFLGDFVAAINSRTFISKLDAAGNFVWAKSFDEHPTLTSTVTTVNFGTAIEVNSKQEVIVTGAFGYTVDFDPGNDTNFLSQSGQTFGNGFFEDYLITMTTDGQLKWAKQLNIYSNYTNRDVLELDSSDNIYFLGAFRDTMNFDGDSVNGKLQAVRVQDAFISKFDSTGDLAWAKGISSLYIANFEVLSVNREGKVFISHFFSDSLLYNNQSVGFSSPSGGGSYILQISTAGNLEKSKIISTSQSVGVSDLVVSNQTSDVFVTGSYSDQVEFDALNGSFVLSAPSGTRAAFVAKLDNNLDASWVKPSGLGGIVSPYSISVDQAENAVTAGIFQDSVNFDPIGSNTSISSNGWSDFYVHKISPCNVLTSSIRDTICGGDTLIVGTNLYTKTGNYIDSYLASNGCDSLVTTELYVIPQRIKIEQYQFCQGDSVVVEGQVYKETGTYNKIIPDPNGKLCDSTFSVRITVDSSYFKINSFQICAGESIQVGSSIYQTTGNYFDTLQTVQGCDSIINSQLTVLPEIVNAQALQICEGDSLKVGASVYRNAGIFADTLISQSGCDSIVNTNLSVIPRKRKSQQIELCFGNAFVFNGNSYDKNGVYNDTLDAASGCDSIISTELKIRPRNRAEQELFLCKNESVLVGGNSYDQTGTYIDTLISSFGCDSVLTTILRYSNLSLDTAGENLLTVKQSNASYQWLDCANSLAPMEGETNQGLSIRTSGSYAVQVDFENCRDTSDCLFVDFEDVLEFSMEVYPNPAKSNTTIFTPTAGRLSVFNSKGSLMVEKQLNGGENKLNVFQMANGVYILRFESKFSLIYEKLVVGR